jgi:Tfp pilus assembly protein PilN
VSNLLPERDKKKIKKEYLLRLLSVSLLFFSITIFLNLLLLLPLYYLSNNKINTAKERISFLESYLQKKEESGLASVLSPTNEKIDALNSLEVFRVDKSIESILSKKNSSIKINKITLRSETDEKKTLSIKGEASSRDNLISFSESLKAINQFTNVELPLSNLAKNINVDFNIKIEIKDTDTE